MALQRPHHRVAVEFQLPSGTPVQRIRSSVVIRLSLGKLLGGKGRPSMSSKPEQDAKFRSIRACLQESRVGFSFSETSSNAVKPKI
mmetsp:Transcript_21116/g.51666  ORF Transcript_21116/g.51666 Transcript_21116/m.51666 type:complete len:86 (-) Transcript_21116:589-846(-)